MGTGWLEVLGTQVLAYRASGSMDPWRVTLTSDCGSQGVFQNELTFEQWMSTARDQNGNLVWTTSSDVDLLEGTHVHQTNPSAREGWEYTWRFERER